jgi:hypothetical protein
MHRRAIAAALIATFGACAPRVSFAQDASGGAAAAPAAGAQTADGEGAELAKKLNNPISDMVSVPFQFNWQNGIGPQDQTQFILNVQPVMPLSVTDEMNMIIRVIAPFVGQPSGIAGGVAASGLSDVLASFFFSPKKSSIVWGVGPAVSLPSTNVPTLGTQKWSAGPTGVVLKQQGGWTVGALVNQIWSFAGQADRSDVNQMFLQPFVAYNTKNLWTFTAQSETTADWMVDGSGRWTAPLNLIVAKLASFGDTPASYQIGWGYFFARPEDGPHWKTRATITILLPKKKK